MHRRAFIAGAATLLAGCGSLAARSGDESTDSETVTPAPVPTVAPTPAVGRERFAGESCPTFDYRTHQTICSHTQSPESSLRLVPDRPVAEIDGDRLLTPVRFTLEWDADGGLSVFADSWYLLREDDAEWSIAASATGRDPVRRIDSGERLYWVLDTVQHYSTDRIESVVAELEPGRYALGVQTLAQNSALYSECLALFDVVES